MIKRTTFSIVVVLMLCFGVTGAHAGVADFFDTAVLFEAVGIHEVAGLLPEQTRDMLAEGGLRELTVESLLQLSPQDFMGAVWRAFLVELRRPLGIFGALLGMTVLCAALSGLRVGMQSGSLREVFGVVTVLCMISAAAAPILDSIMATVNAIQNASIFMLGFIPVFSASVMAAGQPITGAAYNMFLFGASQIISQVVSQTLLPLMSMYLALCLVGGLAPELEISSICTGVKRIVTWSLGFIITLFVGILSVQTMVAGSADTLAVRTAKFMVGSFVPVVGSALTDAMVAAQGCLKLIRTSVGAFGILAALGLLLPVFLQVVVWYGITNIAAAAADLLGVKEVGGILKSCSSVLSIMISFIICYALLMIVTISVVIVTGLGL